MRLLRLFLFLITYSVFIISCSNDDADLINSHQRPKVANRSIPDRSFPIEDLRFQPTQENLDYYNTIKDKVQSENAFLNELSSVLYFGHVMWDAPKIIRNLSTGVTYTFVPVFDPTNYEVSNFFGVKDDNGILTYQLESGSDIRQSIYDNNVNFHVINSANLFAYFDYNFGFTDEPLLHDQVYEDGGDDDGGIAESTIVDCFTTSYTIDVLCTCGGNHYLSELGLCECKSEGYSCGCPSVSSSSFVDCLFTSSGGSGGGFTVDNSGGSGGYWTQYPFINKLKNYVDFSTWQLILDLIDTPCKTELQDYYKQIEAGVISSSFVNCAIQEMSVSSSGYCSGSIPSTLAGFEFEEIDSELLDWILSYSGATIMSDNSILSQLENPVCDMIAAGLTEAEVSIFLNYIKISLMDEPDPGYNDDNTPNPYSPYNIENTIANSNKVSQFLIDYPCVKPFEEPYDNLGLLLSKPDVVDWAIGFLDEDCSDASKTNYTNVVFKALKADSEFVPERFSDLYSIFTNSNDDILLSDCTYDITPWVDLASFVIPEDVNARLESLGWDNQDIDATGFWAMESKRVNLDYHSITIDQLPDLNGDGIATPKELFDEIRLNFPDYADGELTVEITGPDYDVETTWSFFGNDFDDYWNTSSPLKSILSIDTKASLPIFITDDATVICSSYDEGCCWVFSTVFADNFGVNSNNGSHPVSGNRQFGLKDLGNGKYEFYIKAADRARISWAAAGMGMILGGNNASDIFFQITDKAWDNLTNNIVNKINNPGVGLTPGIASQNALFYVRPDWSEVREKLKSSSPLLIIPCDN